MSVFRKQTNRKGNVAYEEVLQKNFEIIETFLKKFHQIFSSNSSLIPEQDQFEQQISKFVQRFSQFDELFDEFRQEQKLSIVMLEKKVNNVRSSTRQTHRSSNRFSKIPLPILEAIESSEANKNYTILKFDSIQSQCQSQESIESKNIVKKQSQKPCLSLKDYEEVKKSIQSARQQISEMKDKINFLSAYTSSLSNKENTKSMYDTLKKQISQSFENQIKSKIENQIQTQMIQTEQLFLHQINNLASQFSNQVSHSADQKYEKINQDIQKLHQILFTHEQADQLNDQLKRDMKKLAAQCMQIFPSKDDTKKSLGLIERKLKVLENTFRQTMQKSDEEKDQFQGFKNAFNVSSMNNNAGKQVSVHKQLKSLSQMIKQKHHNSSMNFWENSKENTTQKTNRKGYELSQGVFFTSKVSKQFMKSFGTNQKKLAKTNLQVKKEMYQIDKVQTEELIRRPQTALRQSMESF